MIKVFQKIKKVLEKNNKIAIFFHRNPEGDCIGSALALQEILKKMGKKVQIFSYDPMPSIYKFLPEVNSIKIGQANFSNFDLGIVLDCSDLKRVGYNVNDFKKIPVIINIDHHSDNSGFGDINYVKKSAAVGEQIYALALFLKFRATQSFATNLYSAIVTDTGGFRFSNTTWETLEIASRLVKSGADIEKINQNIFENKTFSFFKALAYILNKAKLELGGKVFWSQINYKEKKKLGILDEELNEIVDYFKVLNTAKIIVFFREINPGVIKINFRSKNDFDVQKIAQKFGGGGHKRAAGAELKGNFSQVCLRVIKEVRKHFK